MTLDVDYLAMVAAIEPKPSRFKLRPAGEMTVSAPEWLIRGYIETDSLGLMFGDPAAGKSFVAVDMASTTAAGIPWHGHATKQGPVIYVAGEGHNGLARRLKAWGIHNGVILDDLPLFISTAPAMMIGEVGEVLAEIETIREAHGSPVLIVLDTVARNFGAGDENSTADMGQFIAAADLIRQAYKCAVLLVHHTGHADKTRARGSIALRGALDTEYRVDRDDIGVIRLECSKMKDAEAPDAMAFTLHPVELGIHDDEGQPVTSAVLARTDYAPPAPKGRRGKWQSVAMEALEDIRKRHRSNLESAGHTNPGRVSLDDWRVECLSKGMPRPRFYEVRDALITQKKVEVSHGFVI